MNAHICSTRLHSGQTRTPVRPLLDGWLLLVTETPTSETCSIFWRKRIPEARDGLRQCVWTNGDQTIHQVVFNCGFYPAFSSLWELARLVPGNAERAIERLYHDPGYAVHQYPGKLVPWGDVFRSGAVANRDVHRALQPGCHFWYFQLLRPGSACILSVPPPRLQTLQRKRLQTPDLVPALVGMDAKEMMMACLLVYERHEAGGCVPRLPLELWHMILSAVPVKSRQLNWTTGPRQFIHTAI